VDDAARAVASPEAELVQVGDAIGQRAKRRGLVLMPASLRICQTVDGATVMPSPASSP